MYGKRYIDLYVYSDTDILRNVLDIQARGDGNMCSALLEIMEPEISAIKEATREQAEKEGAIRGAVDILRDIGRNNREIKDTIMNKYQISGEEAETFL